MQDQGEADQEAFKIMQGALSLLGKLLQVCDPLEN